MSMLAGQVDLVIGVDTHRDTNTAALVDATTSGVLAHTACSTTRWATSVSSPSPTSTATADGSGRSKAAAATAPD
jgi:hypothetical protein